MKSIEERAKEWGEHIVETTPYDVVNGGIVMEPTDLMIGDWVLFSDNPLKVQFIYNDGYDDVVAEIKEESITEEGVCEEIKYVSLVNCSPIPLTPEILEKNGFDFVKGSDNRSVWNGQWIYKGLELATCCLNREGNWPCYINIYDSNIKCEYVHQLQQVLRLAGLEDIANNFKI